jgi:hypothetical protein
LAGERANKKPRGAEKVIEGVLTGVTKVTGVMRPSLWPSVSESVLLGRCLARLS